MYVQALGQTRERPELMPPNVVIRRGKDHANAWRKAKLLKGSFYELGNLRYSMDGLKYRVVGGSPKWLDLAPPPSKAQRLVGVLTGRFAAAPSPAKLPTAPRAPTVGPGLVYAPTPVPTRSKLPFIIAGAVVATGAVVWLIRRRRQ